MGMTKVFFILILLGLLSCKQKDTCSDVHILPIDPRNDKKSIHCYDKPVREPGAGRVRAL